MSWRITGQILDPATGETVNGVITALLDRTPARTSTGGVIERKASSIPVVEGDIIDTPLNSVPGAVWTFLLPLGQRSVRMVDPGDGASIDLGGELPVGTPVPESEAVLLRREWSSLREQTIDAVDTITSSVDAATQAASTIADVVELKPKINQSITDAAAAKQASSQAVTLAQNANAGTDQGVAGLVGQAGSQTQRAIFKNIGDVRGYGAIGNGEVDDTAAINAAIKKANILGGIVFLPAGTYLVSDALTPLGNGVEIRGQGPYSTVLRTTSTTADVITSTDSYLVGVRDLQIESLVQRTAGAGIRFTRVEGYTIDNVRFIDPYDCGRFDGCHSGWLSRIKVAHGGAALHSGFYWINSVDTHLSSVLINGGTVRLGADAAWFQIDSGCDTWAGVDIGAASSSGSGRCLWFSHSLGSASFAPRWVKVTNFWFEASSHGLSGEDAIRIDAVMCAYFTNGYTASSQRNIVISGGRDIRFAQTVLLNSWLYGCVAGGDIDGLTFESCTFDSSSQGAAGEFSHLSLSGGTRNVSIRGTRFGSSLIGGAKASNAIVNNLPIAQNVILTGNTFDVEAFTSTPIGGSVGIAGMRTRDNIGLNPPGAVTPPAVPARGVALTNPFGGAATVYLSGGAVTAINASGVNLDAATKSVRVPSGGYIALDYTTAPSWQWVVE